MHLAAMRQGRTSALSERLPVIALVIRSIRYARKVLSTLRYPLQPDTGLVTEQSPYGLIFRVLLRIRAPSDRPLSRENGAFDGLRDCT